MWKDNDGTWRANHEDDGGIGGNDHIRIELQTKVHEDHAKFYHHGEGTFAFASQFHHDIPWVIIHLCNRGLLRDCKTSRILREPSFEALTSGVWTNLRVQPRSKIGNTRIGTVATGAVVATSGLRVQSVVVEVAKLPTTPRRI